MRKTFIEAVNIQITESVHHVSSAYAEDFH